MSKFSFGLGLQLATEGFKPSEATMLELRLEVSVGNVEGELNKEEA